MRTLELPKQDNLHLPPLQCYAFKITSREDEEGKIQADYEITRPHYFYLDKHLSHKCQEGWQSTLWKELH